MIIVRPVEASDVPQLLEVYPEEVGAPVNRHYQRFEWQQNGDVTYFVAWDGGLPVGYVFVRWPGGECELTSQASELGCAEVGDLTVVEHARGRGIGHKLMEAVEAAVREREVSLVGLEVTAHNPNQHVARILYEHLGYQDAGYGEFVSGYTYYDKSGNPHRDEELYRYLVKSIK